MCHLCKSRPYGDKREYVGEYSAKKIFSKRTSFRMDFIFICHFIMCERRQFGGKAGKRGLASES